MDTEGNVTLCFVGCGNLGFAILKSLLDPISKASESTSSNASVEAVRLPNKLIACVRSPQSENRLKQELADHQNIVTISRGQNAAAVKSSNAVLLACKPHMVEGVLAESGMLEALQGKLLISVVAGWKSEQLDAMVNKGTSNSDPCCVVRVMPNVGALISESMTAIEISTPPLPDSVQKLVDNIFQQGGQVVHLPPSLLDAATALCGSTPAFFAIFCESLIDGAVAMGMPRESAKQITYQVLRGTAGLLQNGEHPATLKEKVTSPGGCTIGGVMVLEEAGVRGSIAKALRESTSVAALLGSGMKNVNGTRF